mgnify:CR=1 FL=1
MIFWRIAEQKEDVQMKLYNIVFSPTGGTKKVADCLTGALEGDVTTVDLTDSKQDLNTVSLTKEDAAVISVPSYGCLLYTSPSPRD